MRASYNFLIFCKSLVIVTLTTLLIACGGGSGEPEVVKPKKPAVIMVFGDSTSQGYGIELFGTYYENIPPGKMYADLLRNKLKSEGMDEFASITVINESLGSEFAFEGLKRLPFLMAYHQPTHVILAHGTNDARAGFTTASISNTFTSMVNVVKGNGAKAFLADMTLTIFGREYANEYSTMVTNTAKATGAIYVPILLGTLFNPIYTLDDGYGYHQNELAQPIMMQNVWDKLIPQLE
ncbi:MAG TPA: GDSL-type esterase/lipase family protein [Burkholderiaceae bacterium]|nr:GDSL-type esterase/lipase family protein [Burkholderiaceae bacterium]